MLAENLLSRVSVDPTVCFGKPCIRGTRIWISLILDNLSEGVSRAELLTAFPQLAPKDIRAALAYGATAWAREFVGIASPDITAWDRLRAAYQDPFPGLTSVQMLDEFRGPVELPPAQP